MRRGVLTLLAAAVVVFATPASEGMGEESPPASTKAYSSGDGRFTFWLPADWTLEREPLDQSVMAWRARLPGEGVEFLLRCGAKPWRDAFAAFLRQSAANGDFTTAQKERLLGLDQEKLRAAAQAWLARGFTVVKGK